MDVRRTAGKGLYFMFLGEIIALLEFLPVVGAVAALAGMILSVYGLYTLSKAEDDYRSAFILMIFNCVLALVSGLILHDSSLLSILCSLISMGINVAVVYLICNTTGWLLKDIDDEVASRGQTIWKIVLLCTLVEIGCVILSVIPLINIVAAAGELIVTLIRAVIGIVYLVFLWQSQKVLRAC